jgi:hypothetical protein
MAMILRQWLLQNSPLRRSGLLLALSGVAFSATYAMIRWLGPTFMKAGLKGKDMSKVHRKEIPETMGAICAVVYLLIIIVFIPFPFYKDIVAATSGGGNRDVVIELDTVHTGRFLHRFPHSKVRSALRPPNEKNLSNSIKSWHLTYPQFSPSNQFPSLV